MSQPHLQIQNILSQNSSIFLCVNIDKLILHKKKQKTQNSQHSIEKQVGALTLTQFQTHYKVTVIRTS